MTSIGIIPSFMEDPDRFGRTLKRGLLLYDDIIIPDMEESERRAEIAGAPFLAADLRFLAEGNFARPPDAEAFRRASSDAGRLLEEDRASRLLHFPASRQAMTLAHMMRGSSRGLPSQIQNDYEEALWAQYEKQAPAHWDKAAHLMARALAVELRRRGHAAFSVVDPTGDLPPSPERRKAIVLKVVLESLEFPDESTPLEDILAFRNVPSNRQSLLRMRRWARVLATTDVGEREVREELEYLLNEHRSALRRHQLRGCASRIEAFFVVSAEILENLLKLKLAKLTKLGIHFLQSAEFLLPRELADGGSEISYLVRVKRQLGASR
jgi:hypothetical protein